MKKQLVLGLTLLLMFGLVSLASATIKVTTETPEVDRLGIAEKPGGFEYTVTTPQDYPVPTGASAAGSFYYGYVRLARGVTLAQDIGSINNTALPATVGNWIWETTVTSTAVGGQTLWWDNRAPFNFTSYEKAHLVVTQSASYTPKTAGVWADFAIAGRKGDNVIIIRIPAPSTNQLAANNPPLKIKVQNLCVNMSVATPLYVGGEFFNATTAHSHIDELLQFNEYPSNATADNTIASYDPLPFPLAIIGTNPFTITGLDCFKGTTPIVTFGSQGYGTCEGSYTTLSSSSIQKCTVTGDAQSVCPVFTRCFILDRTENAPNDTIAIAGSSNSSDITGNLLTITFPAGIIPVCAKISGTQNEGYPYTWTPLTVVADQNTISGVVTNYAPIEKDAKPLCKATPTSTNWRLVFYGAAAKRIAVQVAYYVNTDMVSVGQTLALSNISVTTNYALTGLPTAPKPNLVCGSARTSNVIGLTLANVVECGSNAGSFTTWFPYVIAKDSYWDTGIAITNLTPESKTPSAMQVKFTLYDQSGAKQEITKTGFSGNTYTFIVRGAGDPFGASAYDAFSGTAGWLKMESNFKLDGFIFYTNDDHFGAGGWARGADVK